MDNVELERTSGTPGDTYEVITPAQVAALLQIHVKTVYRLAEQGLLPGNRIGRRWRFSRREILRLLADNSARAAATGKPPGPSARPGAGA